MLGVLVKDLATKDNLKGREMILGNDFVFYAWRERRNNKSFILNV